MEERHEVALEAAAADRDLSLVISRLEDFSARVIEGLDALNERGRQAIVRALVRRIEIDDPGVEVNFRVPSLDGPAGPPTLTNTNASWHRCSGVRRVHTLLVRPKSSPYEGIRNLADTLGASPAEPNSESGASRGRRLLSQANQS